MSGGRSNGITNKVIQAQYDEYGVAWCEYCGKQVYQELDITANDRVVGDHRIPMSRGGPNVEDNIAISCRRCDQQKGPLTKEEFLSVIDDSAQRKALINKVLYDLGKVTYYRDYFSYRARETQYRNVARRDSLSPRVVDPDPNCVYCAGDGTIKKKGRIFHYCRCSVLPKENQDETS